MRYKIAISREKQVRVFNVESELTLQQMFNLVTAFVKKNYQVTVTTSFKKRKKLISLEELINAVSELRFYKYVTKEVVKLHKEIQHSYCIIFPMDIKIDKQWTADIYGPMTFFKLGIYNGPELISIDFSSLQGEFARRGFDLCRSKTEDIWYTHSHIVLDAAYNNLIIDKFIEKREVSEIRVKVEL